MSEKSTTAHFNAEPNFDLFYDDIDHALAATIYFFHRKPCLPFVIIVNHKGKPFKVMSQAHYMSKYKRGEFSTYYILFKGDYCQLRSLAEAFPLDLFGESNVSQCTKTN